MIGDPEKYPDNIVITPLCPTCSYCGDKMNFATTRVKRPAPPGAVDLEIYDEQHYWQCRRCNAVLTGCLSWCECGKLTIDYPAFGRAEGHRELPPQTIVENHEAGLYGYFCNYRNYQDDIFGFKCISCARCNHCGKELKTTRFIQTGIYSEHNKSEVDYKFYHEDCFPIKQKADEQRKQKAERSERKQSQEYWNRERRKDAARLIPKAILWAIVSYPIVGIGGCVVRQGAPPSPYSPDYDKWFHNPPLAAFSTEAVYVSLSIIGIILLWNLINLFDLHSALRKLLFVLCLIPFGYCGKAMVDSMNFRDKLARTFNLDKGSVPAGGSRETPQASSVIKADKITKGRTPDEKVHEFVLPPNKWVETSLQIMPNQEVMVHHFASNEPVKVNLGGVTDTRLQKAGTILPLYTSKNCSSHSSRPRVSVLLIENLRVFGVVCAAAQFQRSVLSWLWCYILELRQSCERCYMKYRVMIEQDEDGMFVAEVPALPGCLSQGQTREEAIENIKEAIALYLESLEAHGEAVPPPITEELVEVQV